MTTRASIDLEALNAAFDRHAGNKTAMAAELGVHRDTLRRVMAEMGISDKPVTAGRVRPQDANVCELPPKGKIQRYLLTSAQNNTRVFGKFLDNLIVYQDYLTKLEKREAQIMVSRFSYNKASFENRFMSKPGCDPTLSDKDQIWYDSAIEPYICDDPQAHGSRRWRLAPDLDWCAELNVIPTHDRPMSGMDTYAENRSTILPHAKQVLRSLSRMPTELPRLQMTTGAVTQLNYIQRKAGQKAERQHVFGCLIVEVDHNGDWWARQINANRDGSFYDCPSGKPLRVKNGEVLENQRAEAINWGDVHASEIKPSTVKVNWGENGVGGAIDLLRPRRQFYHDLLSMRSKNKHDEKVFSVRLKKFVAGIDIVSEEIEQTLEVVNRAHRPWCEAIVVNSNHDRHGEEWLDSADYRYDLPNCEFFLEAQLTRVRAIKAGQEWSFLEWALRRLGYTELRYLGLKESYLIGPSSSPVQCGLHGDLGVNGAKGSVSGLKTLGHKTNIGHLHDPCIDGPLFCAGTCAMGLSYEKGPTKHAIAHIVTWKTGKRAMLVERAEKLWA